MIWEAYGPTTATAFWGVGVVLLAQVALGFVLQSRGHRAVPWACALLGLVITQLLIEEQPPGYRMLALCAAMLYGMKAVVGNEAVRQGAQPLDKRRWLLFAVAWMGMRPHVFHGFGGPPRSGVARLARLALRNVAIGAGLLLLAREAVHHEQRLLALTLGLPGLSLLVHFGVFHAQTAFFRARGVNVGALFRDPPRSTSLAEFWGKRWNLAFSEMTAQAVHRPLRGRLGNARAVTAAFLFSGLLHELAISGPVNAGWGLPSLYFVLHAVGMVIERALTLEGWRGRAWTALWVLLPMPLLFHGPFLRQIVEPLISF